MKEKIKTRFHQCTLKCMYVARLGLGVLFFTSGSETETDIYNISLLIIQRNISISNRPNVKDLCKICTFQCKL